MAVKIDEGKCTGCEACVDTCPVAALELVGKVVKVSDDCVDCGACIAECPVEAISM